MSSGHHLKRPRADGVDMNNVVVHIKKIVSDINQAVTSTQRKGAIHSFFHQLGYDHETRCCARQDVHTIICWLMDAGAVSALCLQLGYILNKPSCNDVELGDICRSLELMYRCVEAVRESSLKQIGNHLFPLLIKVVERLKTLDVGDNTVREVMTILHACSRSRAASLRLVQCRGLFSAIVSVLFENASMEAKTEALGVMKNLTLYTEDHRLRILEHPGMLPSLTYLAFVPLCDKGLESLSATIRNLAISPNARLIMAQQYDLLSALIQLASSANQRTTRNVVSTIGSLAIEAESCMLLATHGDGMLVNVISRFVFEDEDHVVRRRAARALRLLARCQAAQLIVGDCKVMDALSKSALQDSSREVRVEATEAFSCYAAEVRAPMPHHAATLNALMNMATGSLTPCPDAVARALKEQASCPNNRIPMANHAGLLQVLAKISLSERSSAAVKEDIVCALHSLSCDEANRIKMVTISVLTALVKSAHVQQEEDQKMRGHAVSTLVKLASEVANRKSMVTHAGLLAALVQFAASTSDDPTKDEVKSVILALVPML